MAFKREPGDDVKTPAAEVVTEFDRPEKTPPRVLATEREKTIIRTSTREFIRGAVPHLPALARNGVLIVKYGVVVIGALAMLLQAWAGRLTAKKVDDVQVEAQKTADRAFTAVVNPANEITDALNDALKRIKALETTTAAQSAVIDGFTVVGHPARVRRRVDPGLVKVVRDNAAKNLKELAARDAKPVPVLKKIDLEIPPAPPEDGREVQKPPTPPAPKAEATPPVPTQSPGATP